MSFAWKAICSLRGMILNEEAQKGKIKKIKKRQSIAVFQKSSSIFFSHTKDDHFLAKVVIFSF